MAASKIRKRSLKSAACMGIFSMLLSGICLGILTDAIAETFAYLRYAEFLGRYVVPQKQIKGFTVNVVDYDSIQKNREKPDSIYKKILEQLAAFEPSTIQDREDEIAFWINAYNIGAIKMIIDHYPVDSIRSSKINWLKNPWNKKILKVGNNTYSLGQIEHELLMEKYGDPLIHFAIVCASLSCPDLSKQVYEGDQLIEQMEKQAYQFLQNKKKGLHIRREQGEVFFSQIFKFDKKTFPNGAKDAISLITRFIENEEDRKYLRSGNYEIRYLHYDWDLNALQNAR